MRTTWNGLFRILSVAGILTAAVSPALAGNFFAEELGDEAKISDKIKNDLMGGGKGSESGRGPAPYLKALGAPPKRVALVTFYVKDSGNSDKHPYMGWSVHRNVTTNGVDLLANELYDAAIASMKEGFKSHGIQLLARDEFLDTAAKREAYESFKLEFSAMGHVITWLTHTDKDSAQLEGVAEGYRLLSVPTNLDTKGKDFGIAANADRKLFEGLGDHLAKDLGVDAVAVMYSVVQDQKKTIDMLGSYLYLFGPNPVKRDDNPSLYYTGHQYSGVQIKMRVPVVRIQKEKATDADFAGFGMVAKALASKTGEYLDEKTRAEK